MAGLLAAFSARPHARWLVVACDLPRLDQETLRALIAAWEEGQPFVAYRSEFDGLPEPLCAIYGPSSLPLLGAAVRDRSYCPRKVLIRGSCKLLEPVIPRALENANTPEEWNQALPQ